MADRVLGRYGLGKQLVLPRVTGSPLSGGDLAYWDPTTQSDPYGLATTGTLGVGKSAAVYPWQGSLSATQLAFAAQFVGVCTERWPITGVVPPVFGAQDGYNMFWPEGVFEFDKLAASVFLPTQLVGPDQIVGGGALTPQQVAVVGTKPYAIGRVERYSPAGAASVLVRIFSAVFSPLTNA